MPRTTIFGLDSVMTSWPSHSSPTTSPFSFVRRYFIVLSPLAPKEITFVSPARKLSLFRTITCGSISICSENFSTVFTVKDGFTVLIFSSVPI
ncbi:hypothetical protein D1872_270540 [compost metagenome]